MLSRLFGIQRMLSTSKIPSVSKILLDIENKLNRKNNNNHVDNFQVQSIFKTLNEEERKELLDGLGKIIGGATKAPTKQLLLSEVFGLKEMIDFRANTLSELRKWKSLEPEYLSSLRTLDGTLKSLLREEFYKPGALKLEQFTWNSSSAKVIEYIGLNDRVRPARNWRDLKNRLEGCFAAFGLVMERFRAEPVCFVFVAITEGISGNIQDLLAESKSVSISDDNKRDTLMFYSISSPVEGLNGIHFGGRLIKRVAEEMSKRESGKFQNFCTLSPIPGFRRWLRDRNEPELTEISDDHQDRLMTLCKQYLMEERTRSGRNYYIDPVANFHLKNGAELYRILWKADSTSKAFNESYGMMVNYRYKQQTNLPTNKI